ncbi:polysaccharide deacetylase family protein [Jannaschia marina]|uniref:polysaccharide deacetylase family protein n=1 Tax=Jannaschia marina TaxID=2741674 RepID=UPI0015C78BC1|nr:polysaccharide deacetylase family protein [Jannaschia marina]
MFFRPAHRGLLGLALLIALLAPALAPAADVPPRRGEIALSFDDAPTGDGSFLTGPERTARLIAGLEAAGVEEALFFVMTGGLETAEDAERLRAYTGAGHVLANHTHSHPWLRETEPADYLADIDEAARILSDFVPVAPLFRYPYLDEGLTHGRHMAVRSGLRARGLDNGYVTVDTYDWYMQALAGGARDAGRDLDMEALRDVYVSTLLEGVTFYDDVARRHLGRSPRHVLLLHENDLAALFVPDLVAALRAEGWEIIPAREAYDDPIAEIRPDTLFNGQGRIAAIAHAAGAEARDLVPRVEDETYLRALFVERGLLSDTQDPD